MHYPAYVHICTIYKLSTILVETHVHTKWNRFQVLLSSMEAIILLRRPIF